MRSTRSQSRNHAARGFSLIELLIAIFILGIGVISIAALFPAGIAQQRRSADDMMGPLVADAAVELIRSKVNPNDFALFDFPWGRPAFYTLDLPQTNEDDRGGTSLFTNLALVGQGTNTEVPFNVALYSSAPDIRFPQLERYYPMQSHLPAPFAQPDRPVRPQYVWDCVFRRFQGTVMVAVFVYRVNLIGGETAARYYVPAVDLSFPHFSNPDEPPLPIVVNLANANEVSTTAGPWDVWGATFANVADDRIVLGTEGGTAYDPIDPVQAWQEPGQWLLDQNNNIHRVLSNGRFEVSSGSFVDDTNEPMGIELVRRVPEYGQLTFDPNLAVQPDVYVYDRTVPAANLGAENVVTGIAFIPVELVIDADGDDTPDTPVSLTPVYLTVREL